MLALNIKHPAVEMDCRANILLCHTEQPTDTQSTEASAVSTGITGINIKRSVSLTTIHSPWSREGAVRCAYSNVTLGNQLTASCGGQSRHHRNHWYWAFHYLCHKSGACWEYFVLFILSIFSCILIITYMKLNYFFFCWLLQLCITTQQSRNKSKHFLWNINKKFNQEDYNNCFVYILFILDSILYFFEEIKNIPYLMTSFWTNVIPI